jgi:crotonobetainyl-CoA:carnitine CoA-transferase CaiB-like acyl-CoA transferase
LRANGYFRTLHDDALDREVTMPGPPYRLGRTPATLHSAAPSSGRHNHAIYVEELGLSEGDLCALTSAGVV